MTSIDPTWRPYLDGSAFSSAMSFTPPSDRRSVRARTDVLIDLAADRSVLHVGCVDHLELVEDKRQQGTWLHGSLSSVASRTAGIDTNVEGIDELTRQGFPNVFWGCDASAHPASRP